MPWVFISTCDGNTVICGCEWNLNSNNKKKIYSIYHPQTTRFKSEATDIACDNIVGCTSTLSFCLTIRFVGKANDIWRSFDGVVEPMSTDRTDV